MSNVKVFVFPVVAMMALGCGGAAEDNAVSVSGSITLDDKPLAGAEVYFVTDTFEGYGKTDENGRYRLVNGAAVGPNKVYFKWIDTMGGAAGIDMSIEGMDEGQVQAMLEAQASSPSAKRGSGDMLPPELSDPATTKLSFPVPEGGTESADFRLSSS